MSDNENHQLRDGYPSVASTTDGDQWWNLFADDEATLDTKSPRRTGEKRMIRSRATRGRQTFAMIAGVLGLLALGSVVVWTTGSSIEIDTPQGHARSEEGQRLPDDVSSEASQERLLGAIPSGYRRSACVLAAGGLGVTEVECGPSIDGRGPRSSSFTLFADQRSLGGAFNDVVRRLEVVTCPGNIQSPGPWRMSTAPERNYGALACGFRDGTPVVAWTDDAQLVLSEVRSGANGPDIAELFSWWSGQS